MMERRPGLLLALLPALALAADAFAGSNIDERRDLAPDGLLTVINVAGEIEISTWDRAEVELSGELGDRSRLDIRESARGLRIEVQPEDGGWSRGNYEETTLRLRVPETASISASGVSADIMLEGSRAESIAAETVSGDIEVRSESERLELKSVSGDIDFRGAAGRTSAEAVSGDIRLEGPENDLEVSLVSGDLDLEAGTLRSGQFESVSGTLELRLALADDGRLTVESMSGDVRLSLPSEQIGEFAAQSFSGSIRSDFGRPEREERGPGTRLRHVSGDGRATLRIESFSGDIEIDGR